MSFYSTTIDGVQTTNEAQDVVLPHLIDTGPLDGTFTCVEGIETHEKERALGSLTIGRDSTGWTDATSALLTLDPAIEYVQLGYDAQGGPDGGWADCSTELTAYITAWSVAMTGFGTLDLIQAITVLPGPNLPTTSANGNISGTILRPTALTWPGQDPDNIANRSLWLPSEVASLHDSFTMTDLYAYEFIVRVTAVGYVPTGGFMCVL